MLTHQNVGRVYTPAGVRQRLAVAVEYCKKEGISTVREFSESIRALYEETQERK